MGDRSTLFVWKKQDKRRILDNVIVLEIAFSMTFFRFTIVPLVLLSVLLGSVMGSLLTLRLTERGFHTSLSSTTQQTERLTTDIVAADVVERANPAVVAIVISRDVPVYERFFTDPFGGRLGPRFRLPQTRQKGTERQEVGGGSGFFISSDGYVVTNAHVVSEEGDLYAVVTAAGTSHEARVIAKDPLLDIALLKAELSDAPFLSFGDSDRLRLGEGVVAIGNALAEFENSVSVGVISGLARSITAGNGVSSEHLDNVIQTDAAINPGNSGGPLLNARSEVIGVNVAVAQGSENIGFALPANVVKGAVLSMKETGRVVRPYLGVRYVPVTPALQEANRLPVEYGVLITRGETTDELAVLPGSPADKAGLVENDVILSVDGVELRDGKTLASVLRQKSVGQVIKLECLHKGERKTVEVKLEELPAT